MDYDTELHAAWIEQAKRLAIEYREADDGREVRDAWRALIAHLGGMPASMDTATATDMLRLIETVKYLGGIAEKGEGRQQREDETTEQFLLGYVKRLEAQTRVANCGTADSFIACDDATKRAFFAGAIRESTKRKQAEQDAATYAAQAHRLALELECLMSEFSSVPEGSRWWTSAMDTLDEWNRTRITITTDAWGDVSPSGVVPPNAKHEGPPALSAVPLDAPVGR